MSLINMITNVVDAEKLNDDRDEKTTDDEDKTEILQGVAKPLRPPGSTLR
jgi:hypothetical protein